MMANNRSDNFAENYKSHPFGWGFVYYKWCGKCGGEMFITKRGTQRFQYDTYKCRECGKEVLAASPEEWTVSPDFYVANP